MASALTNTGEPRATTRATLTLADGSEVVVGKDDPIYKKVLARISDLVDKDAEKLEHDDYEPEPEYERDYDYD